MEIKLIDRYRLLRVCLPSATRHPLGDGSICSISPLGGFGWSLQGGINSNVKWVSEERFSKYNYKKNKVKIKEKVVVTIKGEKYNGLFIRHIPGYMLIESVSRKGKHGLVEVEGVYKIIPYKDIEYV